MAAVACPIFAIRGHARAPLALSSPFKQLSSPLFLTVGGVFDLNPGPTGGVLLVGAVTMLRHDAFQIVETRRPIIKVILKLVKTFADAQFKVGRRVRDGIFIVPARISGILAAESDQAGVFRLRTQEIVQAMEGLAGGPGA
jgi:hypothetical protein